MTDGISVESFFFSFYKREKKKNEKKKENCVFTRAFKQFRHQDDDKEMTDVASMNDELSGNKY